ncbi:biotin carboxylase C-terminal domain-containing protein [Trinickia symbiotica]|uniref:hypothetical protein n=1 Tax=Trinickia symbiotica TaxID=863227 RepID=UPI0003635FC3|nr:hypothetical protein [Trinickia symbiotica]PPK47095.1 biotin carboxylase C-terminal domain-containing protein [Trinickia symbiotica]
MQAQILLAAGHLKRLEQRAIRRRGAAVECRLYAENPAKNFLPSPGKLERFVLPETVKGLRIDTGVRAGDSISPFYDPMIAKLISFGTDRTQALDVMTVALAQLHIDGIKHNGAFLSALIQNPEFVAGRVDTGFVQREITNLLAVASGEVHVGV